MIMEEYMTVKSDISGRANMIIDSYPIYMHNGDRKYDDIILKYSLLLCRKIQNKEE